MSDIVLPTNELKALSHEVSEFDNQAVFYVL